MSSRRWVAVLFVAGYMAVQDWAGAILTGSWLAAAILTLILGTGIAIAVGLTMAGKRRIRATRDPLRSLAVERGWKWQDRGPHLPDRWRHGPPFTDGTGGERTDSWIHGTFDGHPMTAFDLNSTHAVVSLQFPVDAHGQPPWMPELMVLHRGRTALGGHNVPVKIVTESGDFNRDYDVAVVAADSTYAQTVLTPTVIDAVSRNAPMNLRIFDDQVLAWWSGPLTADDLLARAGALSAVMRGIPPFVLAEHPLLPDWGASAVPPVRTQ